jgi:lipoprotein-releasing system permease protein
VSAAAQILWGLLTAAGGSLAVTLIVSIVVGIAALLLLFSGSAVVTLERFARVTRRPRNVLVCGVCWALLVGLGSLYFSDPGELAAEGVLRRWALASAGAALATAGVSALCWVALRGLSSWRLAHAALLLSGAGFGLVVGAGGRLAYACAAPAAAALLCAGFAWRRRRAGDGAGPGEVERMLRPLAAALAVGIPVALLASRAGAPLPGVAAAGAWLLAALACAVLLGLVPLAAAGFLDTRGRAEWFIAVRYLVAKRRQTFISVITGICVVGIAAGVWLIITVLSVMNGFERTWREEIIGNRAHLTVQHGFGPFGDYAQVLAAVEAVPEVEAASPYLDAEGMVRGTAGEIMAVRVRGVDPSRVGRVTDLEQDLLTPGGLEALARPTPEEPGGEPVPGILVGSQLAGSLGVAPGDLVTLVSPFGGPQTPLGPAPRLKRFRVEGIFRSSFFQYDEVFTYVTLAAAQDFRRADDVVDGIEVRTPDFYRSQAVGSAIQAKLGFPFYTRDWKEFFPAFFQALKTERVMMLLLLSMIMVVAAFAIVSTLVMMIMEKESDIAILKAMGAEDEAIERIFAIEGTLIGLVGTAIGVLAALSVTARIGWIQEGIEALFGIDTLPAEIYQFSTLPAQLDAGQIVVVVALAMILSLGATLLPSRQAARLDPVEALRYE